MKMMIPYPLAASLLPFSLLPFRTSPFPQRSPAASQTLAAVGFPSLFQQSPLLRDFSPANEEEGSL